MKSIQKAYRIDEEIYHETERFLDTIGMTVPQAINIFFKRILMEQQFPFTPGLVKSQMQIEAEQKITDIALMQPGVTVDFDTGENVEEFFNA